MKRLVFDIDENCIVCGQELRKIEQIRATKRKDRYARLNLNTKKPHTAKVILKPDYNRNGRVTHWHIEKVVE